MDWGVPLYEYASAKSVEIPVRGILRAMHNPFAMLKPTRNAENDPGPIVRAIAFISVTEKLFSEMSLSNAGITCLV